jgi:hypothetical protein
MHSMGRVFILGLCATVIFLPVAARAQTTPTAQGAHDFFSLLASKHLLRSGKKAYVRSYRNNGDCISILDYSSDAAPELLGHKKVDWSSITSAVNMKGMTGANGDSVMFLGAVSVETPEGEKVIKKGMQLIGSDGITRDRIFKAGEFLRMQCDTLSATGF